jgi:acetyl esterase/lipase
VLIAPFRFSAGAVQRVRDVAYGPAGRDNLLDLYRHRSQPTGCPAFVYFHPGGFFSGGKSREARAIIDQLVRHGWVCVSANYRLGRAGSFPNNLVDAKLVIAWLRGHANEYGVDPDTLVVAGGSAGAHLAAMCALTPNDPRFQPGFEDADTGVAAAIGLYGYYGPASTAGPIPSSPAEYVRADAPPFLVIHGARDPMVPAPEVRGFVEHVRDASSSPVVYAELPGGQHNFDQFPSIRCAAVADGIEAFTAWVRSTRGV